MTIVPPASPAAAPTSCSGHRRASTSRTPRSSSLTASFRARPLVRRARTWRRSTSKASRSSRARRPRRLWLARPIWRHPDPDQARCEPRERRDAFHGAFRVWQQRPRRPDRLGPLSLLPDQRAAGISTRRVETRRGSRCKARISAIPGCSVPRSGLRPGRPLL